jgi:hypothetical protein
VPNVTSRDVTERPEAIECGSNILSGAAPESIMSCVDAVLQHPPDWIPPREYLVKNVSETVKRILIGFDEAKPSGSVEQNWNADDRKRERQYWHDVERTDHRHPPCLTLRLCPVRYWVEPRGSIQDAAAIRLM